MAKGQTVGTFGIRHVSGKWFDGGGLKPKMINATDKEIQKGVQAMANRSHDLAPVLHYVLAPSIRNSPVKKGSMRYMYGSPVPYSRRWEFEHRTKSGYFRKSVEAESPVLARSIAEAILGEVERHS